ncbi:MAG: hypothetical protein IH598_01270 [Bacteroidales bacterium]|nr:hypothetical protein [Bacteroidales bacterium]
MKKLSLTFFVIIFTLQSQIYSQTTRYWVGGGESYGNDGNKWSLSSNGTPIGGTITWASNDIAVFDAYSGSNIVVIINATIGTIGKLTITGNQTVTVKPDAAANATLNLSTTTGNAFYLEASSTFIIKGLDAATDRNLNVNMSSNTTATIYGYLKVTDAATGYGEFTKSTGATINFKGGSTYEHNSSQSGSDLPVATWETNSTCLVTGSKGSKPGELDQQFHHFTWNCSAQSDNISLACDLTHVNGNLTFASTNSKNLMFSNGSTCSVFVGGNFQINSGTRFYVANGGGDVGLTVNGNFLNSNGDFTMSDASSSDVTMTVNGSFTLNGGYFRIATYNTDISTLNLKGNVTMSNSAFLIYTTDGNNGNVVFNGTTQQNFVKSGGTILNKVNFTVANGAILNLADYILGDYSSTTGNFTLASGATLITTHSEGITSSGNSGCIRSTGARGFDGNANYQFVRNGAQSTGNGLPSAISGSVTIGSNSNTTSLGFSNPTAINGSLIMMNGTVASSNISYGSSGMLEYRGNAAQTMGNNEWPSSTVPKLKINNSAGVSMNVSKTISNNLNLFSGTLNIGSNHTLTLNNSTITVNSGTLTGSSLSNIIFSGSGNTTLPGVNSGLNDLTINRPGATITIGGAITVYGTMTMTAGTCSLGAGMINYGTSGILKYDNTSVAQTTGNAEFPGTNGPIDLVIDKSSQTLNLHASRQVNGSIYLDNGILNLGSNTLTVAGNFASTVGSIISSSNGHLVFSDNVQQGQAPSSAGLSNLTINRAAGVNMTGSLTVNDNLFLSNGALSIGSNQLTLNGAILVISGTLSGGVEASVNFGGNGASTTLPPITLKSLTIDRSNGIALGGDVTIKNQLTLTSGQLNIGSNTLFLDGMITATNGSLAGIESTLQINDSPLKTATNLPQAELGNLYIYRSDGVNMTGSVTIQDNLSILSGNLSIGQNNTLTLNGLLSESGGVLVSGNGSSLTIGGDGSIMNVSLTDLFNLTLQRPNGMRLINPIKIWGTFLLSNCTIDLNGQNISYGDNGTLFYRGFSEQITTDDEWPVNQGPRHVTVQNFSGVKLHDDRSVPGLLSIQVGSFQIQENTLTLGESLLTTVTGTLTGGENSNLVVGNSLLLNPLYLPSVILNNLVMDRITGAIMQGSIDLYGTLSLINGEFYMNNYTLTLRNPISGNLNNIRSTPASNLVISGSVPGVDIGPDENIRVTELNSLVIRNTHLTGVALNGHLHLMSNLTIEQGSKFMVEPSGWLTIHGDLLLSDDESLVLKSNATATASLILYGQQTKSGSARIERFVKGYTGPVDGWHLLGSPVQTFLIGGSRFDPEASDDLYTYSETDNLWLNYKVPGNFTHFVAGTGYLLASHVDDTKWFSGLINNQDISFNNLSFSEERGWHLLGNPFPSALRWNDGQWHLVEIDHIAKIWDESINNYIDLDPGEHIPPHNGFFIRVNNPINKITIPAISREHSDLNWYKNGFFPALTLITQSLENTSAAVCRVRFHEEATTGFDSGFDSYYLSGFSESPAFYAKITPEKHLSTCTLPFEEETMLELNFSKGLSGSYQINATGLNTFPEGTKILLRDGKQNLSVDLTLQDSYTFVSAPGDDPNRFKLFFSGHTGIGEIKQELKPIIQYSGGKIVIISPSQPDVKAMFLEMFDLTGRCLLRRQIEANGEMLIDQNIAGGIYIIRLYIEGENQYYPAKIQIF